MKRSCSQRAKRPTRYYVLRQCDPATCQMKDCDHTPTVSEWKARRKPWTPREWTPRLDWAKKRADALVNPGVFVVARVHQGAPTGPVIYTATRTPEPVATPSAAPTPAPAMLSGTVIITTIIGPIISTWPWFPQRKSLRETGESPLQKVLSLWKTQPLRSDPTFKTLAPHERPRLSLLSYRCTLFRHLSLTQGRWAV